MDEQSKGIKMTTRKGAAKGTGSGYKNLPGFPRDPRVHDQSRMGIKQPQRVAPSVGERRAMGAHILSKVNSDDLSVLGASKRLNDYSKFQRGVGLFTCGSCGRKTRKTVGDNANQEYCAACISKMEQENENSDKDSLCPTCKLPLKYYHGMLGYESMQCPKCHFDIKDQDLVQGDSSIKATKDLTNQELKDRINLFTPKNGRQSQAEWDSLREYKAELNRRKKSMLQNKEGKRIEDTPSWELLGTFKVENLNQFEKQEYDRALQRGMSHTEALQLLINNVEGDYSQLSPVLAVFAKEEDRELGLSYNQLKKEGVRLTKKGDADGDGVRNAKDCKPLDPSRQDDPVIDITTTGGGIPESAVAKGAGAVLTGTGTLIGGTGRAIGGLGEGVGGLASGVGKSIGERGERAKIEEERMLIKDIDELEQHRLDRQEKDRMRVLLQQRRPTDEDY